MKYSEITEKMIGAAFKMHATLGNGFQEVIYQRALETAFNNCSLDLGREFEMPVFYDKIQMGTRRVNFLVYKKISVELNAIIKLKDVHHAQAMNYLEAYNLEIGHVINFGWQKHGM